MHLLLVFPLQVQSGLDVSSCLLKSLPLGDLSRVVGTDPDHVSAQEDQHVRTDLKTHRHIKQDIEGEKGDRKKKRHENPTKYARVTRIQRTLPDLGEVNEQN